MQYAHAMNRPLLGATLLAALCSVSGCRVDYEHLPQKFELAKGPDQPGLTIMYSEAMRDPANNKFPPVTVRLIGVSQELMHSDSLDVTAVVADDVARPDVRRIDIPLNQDRRIATIGPTDSLFSEQYVFAAAAVAWAAPEGEPQNYVERFAVFDEKGREISQFVAEPRPEPAPPGPDRRAVLVTSAAVKRQGVVLEVDRAGVKAVPAGLKLREARALPAGQ